MRLNSNLYFKIGLNGYDVCMKCKRSEVKVLIPAIVFLELLTNIWTEKSANEGASKETKEEGTLIIKTKRRKMSFSKI